MNNEESLDTMDTTPRVGTESKNLLNDGLYPSVCVGIADCGVEDIEYEGRIKQQRKICMAFAVDAKNGWGETPVIVQKFTLSFYDRSNLSKALASWKVPYTHLTDVIGKSCQLLLTTSSDGKYNNISAILPPKSKVKIPQGIYLPSFWFDLNWKMYSAEGVIKTRRPKTAPNAQAPANQGTATQQAPAAPQNTAAQQSPAGAAFSKPVAPTYPTEAQAPKDSDDGLPF